jgi:threonine aldolase
MISFASDYITGAHPKVLNALINTNLEAQTGYGTDEYCASAREKIKEACECESADIHFLVGGTQTNAIVIATMLKSFEGVISADTGHINAHEAGAVEYTGHKILSVGHKNGKIIPSELSKYMKTFYGDDNCEHMVYPGMVYVSHPTEYGTLYSKRELEEISGICREYGMSLFLDGARLGYGLMSYETDLSLPDIAKLCDVFYIGGTKVGALCGEAVVFTKNNTPAHFVNLTKKHGALLAKGRLLGVQFDALFTDGLYFEIGRYAIDKAERLKKIFKDKGYEFFLDSPTNQQFVVLENSKMEELKREVVFSFWEKVDGDHTVVRFATGWSTTDDDLDALEKIL